MSSSLTLGLGDLLPDTFFRRLLALGLAIDKSDPDTPPLAPGQRLVLDLGEVGVAAEVWWNGRSAGKRAWRPFTFDVTAFVRPGPNRLLIRVANSDAGWQAQGDPLYPPGSWGLPYQSERARLRTLIPNGLEGPVRLRVENAAQPAAP